MRFRLDKIVRTLTGLNYKAVPSVLFAILAAVAILGGTAATVCRNTSDSAHRKIAYCTVAVTILDGYSSKEDRIADLYMHRGLVRADLGQLDAARRDLETWLDKATDGDPAAVLKTHGTLDPRQSVAIKQLNRMKKLDPQSPAALIWQDILAPYQGGSR